MIRKLEVPDRSIKLRRKLKYNWRPWSVVNTIWTPRQGTQLSKKTLATVSTMMSLKRMASGNLKITVRDTFRGSKWADKVKVDVLRPLTWVEETHQGELWCICGLCSSDRRGKCVPKAWNHSVYVQSHGKGNDKFLYGRNKKSIIRNYCMTGHSVSERLVSWWREI